MDRGSGAYAWVRERLCIENRCPMYKELVAYA